MGQFILPCDWFSVLGVGGLGGGGGHIGRIKPSLGEMR